MQLQLHSIASLSSLYHCSPLLTHPIPPLYIIASLSPIPFPLWFLIYTISYINHPISSLLNLLHTFSFLYHPLLPSSIASLSPKSHPSTATCSPYLPPFYAFTNPLSLPPYYLHSLTLLAPSSLPCNIAFYTIFLVTPPPLFHYHFTLSSLSHQPTAHPFYFSLCCSSQAWILPHSVAMPRHI